MTSGMRLGIGGALVGLGGFTVFQSVEAFREGPYWLGGIILAVGILLFVLGVRMFRRAQAEDSWSGSARAEHERQRHERNHHRNYGPKDAS